MFARLGEQTGQLPVMLERAAKQLSAEVQRRALQMATVLEPLLIVVMGGVVMMIVLAVLLPPVLPPTHRRSRLVRGPAPGGPTSRGPDRLLPPRFARLPARRRGGLL